MLKHLKLQITYKKHYLFAALISAFLMSCNNNKNSNIDQKVFRYNEHANINTLDPAFSRTLQDNSVCNQLFNGLVQLDANLNILPSIAKKWTISEDGKTYSFSLRKDVYFHEHELFGKDCTRTVVAEDFTYSLNRLRDDKIAAPGSWVLNKVDDFKAINDTLFEIKLKLSIDVIETAAYRKTLGLPSLVIPFIKRNIKFKIIYELTIQIFIFILLAVYLFAII